MKNSFDAYLTNVDNRQRVYAVHKLEQLEEILWDGGQTDAAVLVRNFTAEIVGDIFARLMELEP